MPEFKYWIDPDKTYTLSWPDDEMEREVTGAEILAAFRRETLLEKMLFDIDDDMLNEITEL